MPVAATCPPSNEDMHLWSENCANPAINDFCCSVTLLCADRPQQSRRFFQSAIARSLDAKDFFLLYVFEEPAVHFL
jgi:hypothetical protein